MPIRLSGLASGLDTESIIKELMSVQSMKKTKIENKLTKLEWKEDKWKDLNSKIYALYTTELSKFKSQASYLTKKVTCSDTSSVSVTASSQVPAGTHSLSIDDVASSQFVTSKQVTYEDGTSSVNFNVNTKIAQVAIVTGENPDHSDILAHITAGTQLTLNVGNKEKLEGLDPTKYKSSTYTISNETTVYDLSKWFKENGVTFNYDSENGRFFLSASESGTDHAFTLTSSEDYTLKDGHGNDTGFNGVLAYNTGYEYLNDGDVKTGLENIFMSYGAQIGLEDKTAFFLGNDPDHPAQTTNTDRLSAAANAHEDAKFAVYTDYMNSKFEEMMGDNHDLAISFSGIGEYTITKLDSKSETSAASYRTQFRALVADYDFDKVMKDPDAKASTGVSYKDFYNEKFTENYNEAYVGNNTIYTAISALTDGNNALDVLGIGELTVNGGHLQSSMGAATSVIDAKDMECTYNGVHYTSSTNSISINGLTINAISKTAGNVQLNISNDTTAVYDMVKGFIKQYNTILKEVNDLYYAKVAKGYDVLTDEEKDKMSDKTVEKWENKIKDTLLRRDDTLMDIMGTLTSITATNVKVNGKDYNLTSFGINTKDYTEKGLLHIFGDPEDSMVSDEDDKLNKALSDDPDTVMQVLTGIGNKLYSDLTQKMGSTSLSSALTFYNDKQITSQKKEYEDDIKAWKKKLTDMEDRYYSKFSAMEAAMSKLNSQTNYISSLFGGASK